MKAIDDLNLDIADIEQEIDAQQTERMEFQDSYHRRLSQSLDAINHEHGCINEIVSIVRKSCRPELADEIACMINTELSQRLEHAEFLVKYIQLIVNISTRQHRLNRKGLQQNKEMHELMARLLESTRKILIHRGINPEDLTIFQ